MQLRVKQEAVQQATQEDRASRLEHRMQRIRVAPGRVKQERFDDDSKREGRGMQRVSLGIWMKLIFRAWKADLMRSWTTT